MISQSVPLFVYFISQAQNKETLKVLIIALKCGKDMAVWDHVSKVNIL